LSVGVFFLGASEATVRAAALAASVCTALLLMLWAQRRSGSVMISLFCGLAIAVHPYFIHYGQTARGYSFTTLLLLTHILLLDEAMAGKRGMLRLGLSILVGFALFLNLISSVFIWLVPLYLCVLWKLATTPAATGSPHGLMGRIRSEEFVWWFFQAAAVGALVLFFALEHLPKFVRSEGDYGAKVGSAAAALHPLMGVVEYLFPGQWLLLAAAGVAGWCCAVRSRYWLAGPMAGSVVVILLYAMGSRTVPYERTFGIWIVFAIIGCAWLWQQWVAYLPRMAWLPPIGASLLIVYAIIRPQSMLSGPDYAETAIEISREVQSRGETPGNTFIAVPFLSFEECRLYLPEDSGFVSLAASPVPSLAVYLPCKSLDGIHDGFRCTYYQRSAEEMVYFRIPEGWRRFTTWRKGGCSVIRLEATAASGIGSIAADEPQIVVWRAANSFFDLERYVNDQLVKNPDLPELRFTSGYYFQTPTLIFFVNGDATAVKKALAGLDAAVPGSVLVLTPRNE
jgi:hypothetical protein